MSDMVQVDQLSFAYAAGQSPVIERFCCTVNKGEIVGILGPSGCGKSTLLRLIAGLECPRSGEIRIGGKTMVNDSQFVPPERRGVGMLFQDYALFPHLTVAKNIAFGLHKLPRPQRESRLKEMIELVQLHGFEHRYPHELSGGQQQRVALARALAPQPDVLLMDEPFSNLDAELKASIRIELRDILRKAGITCLLVTHDRADVDAICDRRITVADKQEAGPARSPVLV